MKRIVLGILMLIPFLGISQIKFSKEFDIELSKAYPVVDATSKDYFSFDNGAYLVSVKFSPDAVSVHLFDVADMSEVKQNTYEDLPKYSKFIDVVKITDEEFYLLYNVYDKKAKKFTVYSRTISGNEAKLGSPKKLFTTGVTVTADPGSSFSSLNASGSGYLDMINRSLFKVKVSFDKSKIMIGFRAKPAVKSDKVNKDVIGMFVFDSQMESIWGEEVTMPYTEALMNNLAYGVGNAGGSYILAKKVETDSYELLVFKDGELEKYPLDIDSEMKFMKLDVRETAGGDIVCAGYYANGIEYKLKGGLRFNTDGVYFFTITKDGEMTGTHKIPFDIDFIGLYLTDKQRAKLEKREADGKAGISDLQMVEVQVNADGSMIFVGESRLVVNEGSLTQPKWVYYMGNMVIMKVQKSGDVDWVRKLPKNQIGVNTMGGMSFKYVQGPNNHYLVYVDNAKNAELDATSVPKLHRDGMGGILSTYVIDDATGDVSKHLLADISDVNGKKIYQFQVSRIMEASAGILFTEVYLKGKQDGMIKMSVK